MIVLRSGLNRRDLVLRHQPGHADDRMYADLTRRIGECPAVIAGRSGDHPRIALRPVERQDGVGGPAQLKTAGRLQMFAFKPDRHARPGAQTGSLPHRRAQDMRANALSRLEDFGEGNGHRHRSGLVSKRAVITPPPVQPMPQNLPSTICPRPHSRSIQSAAGRQPILLQPEPQKETSSLDTGGALRDLGSAKKSA